MYASSDTDHFKIPTVLLSTCTTRHKMHLSETPWKPVYHCQVKKV